MSELETYDFSLPADLSTPLERHAIESVRLEVTRLLLIHEFPVSLEIDFQSMPSPELPMPHEPRSKRHLHMPAHLEPSFTCIRTPEKKYEVAALLPFSRKMQQFIGACSIGLTMHFPNREKSMMGEPKLHWLSRIFAVEESESSYEVRPTQTTPAATLRDFSHSLSNLRKGMPLTNYTYDWVCKPPNAK